MVLVVVSSPVLVSLANSTQNRAFINFMWLIQGYGMLLALPSDLFMFGLQIYSFITVRQLFVALNANLVVYGAFRVLASVESNGLPSKLVHWTWIMFITDLETFKYHSIFNMTASVFLYILLLLYIPMFVVAMETLFRSGSSSYPLALFKSIVSSLVYFTLGLPIVHSVLFATFGGVLLSHIYLSARKGDTGFLYSRGDLFSRKSPLLACSTYHVAFLCTLITGIYVQHIIIDV